MSLMSSSWSLLSSIHLIVERGRWTCIALLNAYRKIICQVLVEKYSVPGVIVLSVIKTRHSKVPPTVGRFAHSRVQSHRQTIFRVFYGFLIPHLVPRAVSTGVESFLPISPSRSEFIIDSQPTRSNAMLYGYIPRAIYIRNLERDTR